LSRLLAGKTVLVIAHRMRTVEAADKIIVLADGRVAEEGTPAELMDKNGLYRRMVELQRQSAGWRLNS
ncbi:MAG: ABC transporter ATP-binding protein, partial [Acetatifactor muris]|nr:ABC transporter ATP-binding protein [Acetatifactor muris]